MAQLNGMFGQQDKYSVGRAKYGGVTSITVNTAIFLGCVPRGHHAQLTVHKVGAGADVDVDVSCKLGTGYDTYLSEAGTVINTADPPLDLYDPDVSFPVFVQKHVSGSADFEVKLCITDDPTLECTKAYPLQVGVAVGSGVLPGVSVVPVTKPAGVLLKDLLIAFVGCSNHTAAMGATPVEKKDTGSWVPDSWELIGSLDDGIDPRIRVYCKLADSADAATVTEYRWNFAGGPYSLAVNILAFRADGASNLGSYGLGMLGSGFPTIWNGSGAHSPPQPKTTDAFLIETIGAQLAPLNVDTIHIAVGLPKMAVVCFGSGNWLVPGAAFMQVSSQRAWGEKATKGEFKAANTMLGAAALVLAQDSVQITGIALGASFDFQGGYIVLGQLS